jgi:hypothetical protein
MLLLGGGDGLAAALKRLGEGDRRFCKEGSVLTAYDKEGCEGACFGGHDSGGGMLF